MKTTVLNKRARETTVLIPIRCFRLVQKHIHTHLLHETWKTPNSFFFVHASGVLEVKNTNPLPYGFIYKIIQSHLQELTQAFTSVFLLDILL